MQYSLDDHFKLIFIVGSTFLLGLASLLVVSLKTLVVRYKIKSNIPLEYLKQTLRFSQIILVMGGSDSRHSFENINIFVSWVWHLIYSGLFMGGNIFLLFALANNLAFSKAIWAVLVIFEICFLLYIIKLIWIFYLRCRL